MRIFLDFEYPTFWGTCSKFIISARFLTFETCYRAYIHQTNYFGRFYPILRLLRQIKFGGLL